MGLFSVRRAASRDHSAPEGLLSPSKKSSAILANLFTDALDDGDDRSDNEAFEPVMPAIKATSTMLSPNSSNSHKTDRVTSGLDRKQTGRLHRPESVRSPSRASEVISRISQRDSIKRSLSRKMARSESRRQMLNIKDDRDSSGDHRNEKSNTLSFSDEKASKESSSFAPPVQTPDALSIEGKLSRLSMSPVTPAIVAGIDPNIEAQIAHDESLAISCDPGALSMTLQNSSPSSGLSRKNKSRRRPPPLIGGGERSVPDSAADWPSAALFGTDGGFVTGGFKITADGMVGKPDVATRQDSDPEIDMLACPNGDNSPVFVKSLKELRSGPTIGSGAAGRVYIAEHTPSNSTLAIKVVNVYSKEKRNQLLKELETLSTHISRFLVRFHGAFYDGSGAVHIALEYMDHGCLSTFVQRVGRIPEKIVQMIASDCVRGLRFLHRHHVLHRDFKTANILLSRKNCCAKLSDFGLARDLNPGVSKVDTFVGTVAYMSPERLQGSPYTYASDIWALGVSVVECLLGKHPFNQPRNYFDYIEATAASGTLHGFDDKQKQFSSEVRDFISLCTYTDPKRRPQAAELLEHKWIKGVRRDVDLFGSWLDECRTISMQVASTSSK